MTKLTCFSRKICRTARGKTLHWWKDNFEMGVKLISSEDQNDLSVRSSDGSLHTWRWHLGLHKEEEVSWAT